ncbi:sensor histidine kinase [Pedobacter sp. GR22-6]|uniref:sensor histidine kinase n=1 Tax=Pedobacter sp. GR22-6 TaxID=3127957 RepID=UPI00307EE528
MKTAKLITQMAGWILFFSLPVVFMFNEQQVGENSLNVLGTPSYWIFCSTYLLIFYLSSFVLIPHLYLKGRYTLFFSIVALLFIGVYLLKPFDKLMSLHQESRAARGNREMPGAPRTDLHPPSQFHNQPAPFPRPMPHPEGSPAPNEHFRNRAPGPQQKDIRSFDIVSVFLFIMVIALTMAIEINKQLHLTQKKAIKAEADRAEAELSFLKAQINPHFLYNTLNNIYTLAVTNHPNTAPSIMKLSNIMRYMTDDITVELVPLRDELDCIANFIGLQELRLGAKTPIDYQVEGLALQHKIAPLILMTFVENAFKYGISKQTASPILIKVSIADEHLVFFAQNRDFSENAKLNSTGIGIQNTRQRLQHAYPGKHELTIEKGEGLFTVQLKLEI